MALIPEGFPPYEYRPYPKWVHFDDGRPSVLVEDAAEHEAALADAAAADEKTQLIAEADAKGIKIDKRWAVDKIRVALAGE